MKTPLILLAFLLSLTLAAQSYGLSLTLAQGLNQSNENVHLASDIYLSYSFPTKSNWSVSVTGLFAKATINTGLRFPSDRCTSLFSSCSEASVSFVSKESRAGLSLGVNKHWDRLSFGILLRGVIRLNNQLDVRPNVADPFFATFGTDIISTSYGESFVLNDDVADIGAFIALSDRFRLQPGLMIDYAFNKTISIGLTSRLDILSPNRVKLQSIGGFRPNNQEPMTLFEGKSRAYYFQGTLRCFIW